ncbi:MULTISPECIES: MerR family transcriptional regulator [Metallibacterium]|jgi:MerR family copper efflux transcriptional regulator|uniref:MerR family transcriptional regulator n=1 Tax=Metallibacterium TaxID=1218803 RepID=UPI00262CA2E0|nr:MULTISPECIES: MerR family transcriptional regulator [Metallibacterium]MBW8074289.1 MerR family transcriptional regulator [Metallibacterium scheffleri]
METQRPLARSAAHLTIGRVARAAGVAIDTIRYYEREGLLPEPERRLSGYRDYTSDAITRLRFIRRAKELGFSLPEIRELLALSADRERGVRGVKQRAEARLTEIERRIRELKRVQRGLKSLIDACPGHGAPERCPILTALSREESP